VGCGEASGAEPGGGEHAGDFLFLLWSHAGAYAVVCVDVSGSVGVRDGYCDDSGPQVGVVCCGSIGGQVERGQAKPSPEGRGHRFRLGDPRECLPHHMVQLVL
jgi:hypothetical protein